MSATGEMVDLPNERVEPGIRSLLGACRSMRGDLEGGERLLLDGLRLLEGVSGEDSERERRIELARRLLAEHYER